MAPGHARFAQMLTDLGLSQREAAKELRCSQSYVHYLASGERGPGRKISQAIRKLSLRWDDGPIALSEWDSDPAEAA